MRKQKSSKKLSMDEEFEVSEMINARKNSKQFSINKLKISFKPKTENQKNFVKLIHDHEICIGAGFAGTGKTFVACAKALQLLQEDGIYKKIILVKSVTDLKGESLGFLKGDLSAKIGPYIECFKDNFNLLIGEEMTNFLFDNGIIKVEPLAFVRGRSFSGSIVIVEEAQNLSWDAMRSILTRISFDSKYIIIGDFKQIDLGNKKDSCLEWLIGKFQENDKFGVIQFGKEDQVRNPLINIIEDMFDDRDNNKRTV